MRSPPSSSRKKHLLQSIVSLKGIEGRILVLHKLLHQMSLIIKSHPVEHGRILRLLLCLDGCQDIRLRDRMFMQIGRIVLDHLGSRELCLVLCEDRCLLLRKERCRLLLCRKGRRLLLCKERCCLLLRCKGCCLLLCRERCRLLLRKSCLIFRCLHQQCQFFLCRRAAGKYRTGRQEHNERRHCQYCDPFGFFLTVLHDFSP